MLLVHHCEQFTELSTWNLPEHQARGPRKTGTLIVQDIA